jgi:5S rRNA maturation endonuclease (ribonuclease M5)
MLITEQEIHEIQNFIIQLNSMKDSIVIVEGKRDTFALKKLGFVGLIIEFHRFGGMINFVDYVARYKKLIILFDRDKKGKHLTRKTIELLQHRVKIDLSFKRKLTTITRGKIVYVEQMTCYES